MRMWGVDPKVMCNRHLLGEHVEMHMFVGTIKRGTSLRGYIDGGLVETHLIDMRHDELAREMIRRGMNHKSPIEHLYPPAMGRIDRAGNLRELASRCPECARLQAVARERGFLK